MTDFVNIIRPLIEGLDGDSRAFYEGLLCDGVGDVLRRTGADSEAAEAVAKEEAAFFIVDGRLRDPLDFSPTPQTWDALSRLVKEKQLVENLPRAGELFDELKTGKTSRDLEMLCRAAPLSYKQAYIRAVSHALSVAGGAEATSRITRMVDHATAGNRSWGRRDGIDHEIGVIGRILGLRRIDEYASHPALYVLESFIRSLPSAERGKLDTSPQSDDAALARETLMRQLFGDRRGQGLTIKGSDTGRS